jgi:hypothetical protein
MKTVVNEFGELQRQSWSYAGEGLEGSFCMMEWKGGLDSWLKI